MHIVEEQGCHGHRMRTRGPATIHTACKLKAVGAYSHVGERRMVTRG